MSTVANVVLRIDRLSLDAIDPAELRRWLCDCARRVHGALAEYPTAPTRTDVERVVRDAFGEPDEAIGSVWPIWPGGGRR